MDKRSPDDIRKSIKSLVEEAESVSVEDNTKDKETSKNEDINKILSSFYDDNNLIVFMGAGSITHLANSIIKK